MDPTRSLRLRDPLDTVNTPLEFQAAEDTRPFYGKDHFLETAYFG